MEYQENFRLMDKYTLRKEIRKIISEHNIVDSETFYINASRFPYTEENAIGSFNFDKEYLTFKNASENEDMYEWPEADFKLGIEIEHKRNPKLSFLNCAQTVIQQMKLDKNFYNKMT